MSRNELALYSGKWKKSCPESRRISKAAFPSAGMRMNGSTVPLHGTSRARCGSFGHTWRIPRGVFISLVTTHHRGFAGCRVHCIQASELHAKSTRLPESGSGGHAIAFCANQWGHDAAHAPDRLSFPRLDLRLPLLTVHPHPAHYIAR